LLDAGRLDLCARFDVGISVSLDGPEAVTNRYRRDLRGHGSYARVRAAVARLKAHPAAVHLFSGLLAVVDPGSDPNEIYSFFKEIGTPSVDFLYRDGNHDLLPFGKASFESTEYGKWMVGILDLYLSDPDPPKIRVLDDMLKLLLGGAARKEGIGISDYGIVVLDTDGSIAKNDTLKSVGKAADGFASQWSVLRDRLADVVATPEFEAYHRAQRPSSPMCLRCPELSVCGGGMPAHRWSTALGFENPSIFCADQLRLIDRMREWIGAHRSDAA
jgi:uncharacterized protein